MNDINTDSAIRGRIKATQARVLDAIDGILDKMTPQAPATPPIAVTRRLVANTFKLWRYCDRSQCRRSQCCRGEPRHCLHACLPLVPAKHQPPLMQRGKARTERQRRKRVMCQPAMPITSETN